MKRVSETLVKVGAAGLLTTILAMLHPIAHVVLRFFGYPCP